MNRRASVYSRAMDAKLIDGTAIAAREKARVGERVAQLAAMGKRVHLTAILVGSTAAGEIYAQRQGEACRAVGIEYSLLTFANDISQKQLKSEIRRLSDDPQVTGIMLHLPL